SGARPALDLPELLGRVDADRLHGIRAWKGCDGGPLGEPGDERQEIALARGATRRHVARVVLEIQLECLARHGKEAHVALPFFWHRIPFAPLQQTADPSGGVALEMDIGVPAQ